YPMKGLFGDEPLSRAAFMTAATLYGTVVGAAQLAKALAGASKRDAPPNGDAERLNHLGEPMWPKKMDIGTEWSTRHIDVVNEWNRRSHKHQGSWSQKAIFCKNVTFVPNLVDGKIDLRDGGIDRIDGNRVYFKPSAPAPGRDGGPLGETSNEFDAI